MAVVARPPPEPSSPSSEVASVHALPEKADDDEKVDEKAAEAAGGNDWADAETT